MDIFQASRLSQNRRIVDELDRPKLGRIYEVVEDSKDASKKKCKTKRCRDFAVRIYEIECSPNGIPAHILKQSQGLYLHHPNLLEYKDIDMVFSTRHKKEVGHVLILMELASGNLYHWLEVRRPKVEMDDTLRIIFDIVQGIAYLHENKYVHKKLHPGNILLVEKDAKGDEDDLLAKIGDFQNFIMSDVSSYSSDSSSSSSHHPDEHSKNSKYLAPEILISDDDSSASFASDIWSLGIVVFEMLFGLGRTPFSDATTDNRWFKSREKEFVMHNMFKWLGKPNMEWQTMYGDITDKIDKNDEYLEGKSIQDRIENDETDFKLEGQQKEILKLIDSCLKLHPKDRISAHKILNLPMFSHFKRHTGRPDKCKLTIQPGPVISSIHKIRQDIIANTKKDIQNGFMRYYPAVLALHIFNASCKLFEQELQNDVTYAYQLFCSCYVIGMKLMTDWTSGDVTQEIQGCTSIEHLWEIEKKIVTGLKFRFCVTEIAALPVSMSVLSKFEHPKKRDKQT